MHSLNAQNVLALEEELEQIFMRELDIKKSIALNQHENIFLLTA